MTDVVNTSEKVVTFSNEEYGSIRTITIDGEPWFVGKDVAKALGYSKSENALQRHVDEEDKSLTPFQGGCSTGRQNTTIINESGLYSLILSSKLPSAKKFKHWVTAEVLPAIRKTGGYSVISKPDSYMIDNPIERAKRWIEEEQERIALRETIEQQKPMVEFAEHVTNSSDCIGMGEFAKVVHDENIKLGRNKLFEWMRDNHIFMQGQTLPYQKYIDNGWFNVVEVTKQTAYGAKVFPKTVITGVGQVNILEKLRKEFAA